jgi:uncharacterized protein YjbI with pentapeptide repeats
MARSRPKPTEIGATQAPEGELAEAAEIDPSSLSLREARLRGAELDDVRLRGLSLLDVEAEDIGAANGDWVGAQLRRLRIRNSRLTGLDLGEARIEEVLFEGCKLDFANFRHATIEFTTFEDCVLTEADFRGARIFGSRFHGCKLDAADFSAAELGHVDLRGSQMALLGGSPSGLRGATVDSLQLIDLSRAMARELGIEVEEA